MRTAFITLLCISLAACAANPLIKADNPHPDYDDVMARDAAGQLARLYPPAKTQLNLVESEAVGFGALLADQLRAKGYAVTHAAPQKAGIRTFFQNDGFGAAYPPKSALDSPAQAASPAETAPGIELRYARVHFKSADFARLTLFPGKSILARAYLAGANGLAPAGAWTFKE